MKLWQLVALFFGTLILVVAVVEVMKPRPVKFTEYRMDGQITLAGGLGSSYVQPGSVCLCTDTTANWPVRCEVSGRMLIADIAPSYSHERTSDVIAFHCVAQEPVTPSAWF